MISVDGNNMSVYKEGSGDKTLVFLSGGGTCSPILDFKSLYSLLSDEYQIVVVEKFGYGYSDVVDRDRDIDSILDDTRKSLEMAGIKGPYVLCPHSMSGLEALYWANKYPDEVTAIIGLDMAVPQYYENMKTIVDKLLALYPKCKIVLHRPVWYSPNTYNGAKYLEEGLNRLQSYYPELQALVLDYSKHFPGQVFMGDTDGFDYFKTHYKNELFPEKGNAGTCYLLPNRIGASALGELWGKAILGAIDN